MSDVNIQTFSGKVNVSNNFTVGSGHLFVDTQDNKVGLNTATPNSSLHVNGNAYVATDITFGGILSGDGSGLRNVGSGSWSSGTGNVYLSTSTDNVGIGTSEPPTKLTVSGSSGGAPPTTGGEGTSNGIFRIRDDYNVALDFGTLGVLPWSSWIQAQDATSMNTTYPLSLNPNGGNVGIGTTSPGDRLDVRVAGTAGTRRTALRLTTPESQAGTGCNIDFYQSTALVGRVASVYEAGGQLGMGFSTYLSGSGLVERLHIGATGATQILRDAHNLGTNTYTLELYSGNTGNNSKELSIRFHQGSQYWTQIRVRYGQFYFTNGYDDGRVAINAGDVNSSGTVTGSALKANYLRYNSSNDKIYAKCEYYGMGNGQWKRVVGSRFAGTIIWTALDNDKSSAIFHVAENSNAANGSITISNRQTDYYNGGIYIEHRWNGGYLEFNRRGTGSYSGYFVTVIGAIVT